MAYELPVILSVLGNTIKVAHPTIPDAPQTSLTAGVSAAGLTLTVFDNNGFTNGDYIIVGEPGQERSEIRRIGAAVTAGTSLTVDALTYDHPIDTPVTFIPWNQVEISRTTTTTGTKTEITTMNIQIDRPSTTYVNTGTVGTYYFARYENSASVTSSEYSDYAIATGYATTSVRAAKDEALSMVNEKVSDVISEDFLNKQIYNCEQEVWSEKRRWSWSYTFDYILGDTAEGGIAMALPSDIARDDNMESILSARIKDRSDLQKITKQEWNIRMQTRVRTTVSTAITALDTTLTLTDVSDLDATGSVEIDSDTFTYTSKSVSAGTITGATGITSSHSVGIYVWQNTSFGEPQAFTVINGSLFFDSPVSSTYAAKNVYLDYYRKPTDINSDSDTLNIPDFTVYHYYLAWKILLRKANGAETSESKAMKTSYLERKQYLKRTDRTGQTQRYHPRLNSISYGREPDIIGSAHSS